MKKVKRAGRLGVVAIVLAIGLTGCGATTPKANGADIANAKEFLESAEATFKEDVAQLGSDVVTVAEDAKCFFEEGSGTGEVTGMIYCGPVKRYGETGSWTGMSFQGSNTSKGVVLSEATKKEQADPKGKLFRPDNASPGDPEKLAAPLGPRTDQKEFAVLIPFDSVASLKLTDLGTPAVLKEPAGTFTVTAKAELEGIPGEALRVLNDYKVPAGGLGMRRPAEGQNLGAWKVDLANPEDIAPEYKSADPGSDVQKPRAATAALSVEIGQTQLNLRGVDGLAERGTGSSSDDKVSGLSCSHVKCGEVKAGQYLLVVSTASLDGAQLVATTDGQSEKVSLEGGATQTDHSQVLYQGGKTKAEVSTNWGPKTFEAVSAAERAEATFPDPIKIDYDGSVTAAYRTPFEATLGWAPAGQAWLVLSLENQKFESANAVLGTAHLNWTASWTVTTGGSALEVVDTGYTDRVVLKIPQDASDFQVAYQPKGTIGYHDQIKKDLSVAEKQKEVAAPETETVDITFS